MADVFISYKAERKNAAEHLRHILEAHGFSVWYDYQLKTGTDFDLQIMRELNAAKAVVVLWDTMSVKSPWVKLEAMTARYNDTYVPVMIEDCTLETEFAKGQYEDLRRWSAEPAAFRPEGLIETLEEKLSCDAIVNRTALKQHHREWRKYGSQSLKQFALLATPDRREAEKAPPVDITAAALAASRQSELSRPADDWVAEFRTIENSVRADDYRLFLSHQPSGTVAFRAARQLRQIEDWDAVDKTSIPVVETFLGTNPFPALAYTAAKRLGELKATEIARRRAEEEARRKAQSIVGRDEISPPNATATPNIGISSRPTTNIEKKITEVRFRYTLKGHESFVMSVAFSTDGKTALTGSSDKTTRLWSLETGETLAILKGHERWVWSAQFSPDGKTALTGSSDNTARLWSLDTGEVLAILKGHEGRVLSTQFSSDGKTALTGSQDKTARLWSLETGETLQTLKGHEGWVDSVQVSPDGKTVLTGSSDKTARLWSLETGEVLAILKGHEGSVYSVAFSPDGKTALTGSWDDTARLWSLETGEVLAILKGHESVVRSVHFSPDGKTALTGSADKTARLWSLETGETLTILKGHEGVVRSAQFSPDGKTALTGSDDKTARLWDVIYE